MPKILLVEDDNNLREIFEMRLKAEGFDTVTAGNGEEALVVAMKERPDLIISDVMMPKLSGFEMLETLRAAPEMADTKAIMMTALGQAEDRARGEQLGVIKYLVKSQVTLEDFVRVVREVVQPGEGTGASSAPGPANSDQTQINQANQESETHMPPADSSTNPNPAPAGDGAADASNPIAGGTTADSQQTTEQEQNAVQSQIDSFVSGGTGTDTAAPASDAAAAPAADAGTTGGFGGEPTTTSDAATPGATTPAAPVDGTSTAAPEVPASTEPAQPAPEAPTNSDTPAAPGAA